VASYNVVITKSAAKEIEEVDSRRDRQRIVDRISRLADDPRPPGSKKLSVAQEQYRIRQGNYRVLYSIEDAIRVVTVVAVGNRKDVYRRGRA
jgi:mRNA interferase RelE/StbE